MFFAYIEEKESALIVYSDICSLFSTVVDISSSVTDMLVLIWNYYERVTSCMRASLKAAIL